MIPEGIDAGIALLTFALGFACIVGPVVILGALLWGARWRIRLWFTQQVASWRWRQERKSPDYPDEPI